MNILSAILFACCFALTAFGQQLTLNGSLMTDAKAPVPATRISVHGIENTTDSKGQFKLVLPGDFSEGERVIIKVVKPNWVINYPLDGEWNLPNVKLQDIQTLDVIIVPKGSKALWTHARIEKQIAKLSDEIAKLKKEGDTPRPIDFGFYLREWAEQYGFTAEQVKSAFDDWAKAVEKSDDYRTLGLRAFYQNNFRLAAENFVKAAQKDEGQIKLVQEQLDREILSAYQNRKDAGSSFSNSYQFKEALEQYNIARLRLAELTSKDKHRYEQAEMEALIGIAKVELGIRVEGEEGNRLFSEAIDSYMRAFAVFTREQAPQQWAATQNNLGAALSSQGERMAGVQGVELLAEAVSAFRSALLVRTREQAPQQWATTQNNLGIALKSQGERIAGDEGAKLLAEAVSACRNALLVRTREQAPQQWATTQNNMGAALQRQGERLAGDEGVKLLAEAIIAHRNALQVITREQSPQQWATIQNYLGIALRSQGERMTGDEGGNLLAESVAAYRSALLVRTREHLPQQWAVTQNNLGVALQRQGERMGGDEGMKLLAEAVSAYHSALLVRTREQAPQQWAITQNNLGDAYYLLSEWSKAAECYANFLTLYPNNRIAYKRLSGIFHERWFDYKSAFELNQLWLTIIPDDLSAMTAFAETHFTTGRFAECRERIAALLAKPEIEARTKIALRLIEIANLLALGQAAEVPAILDLLIEAVAAQPADFKITWTFNGALHFIGQSEKLAVRRDWLKLLFSAAEGANREAALKTLREAKTGFKP